MVQDFIGNKLVGGNNHFIMVKKNVCLFLQMFNFVYVGTKCREVLDASDYRSSL
jgi:hypothetical protein